MVQYERRQRVAAGEDVPVGVESRRDVDGVELELGEAADQRKDGGGEDAERQADDARPAEPLTRRVGVADADVPLDGQQDGQPHGRLSAPARRNRRKEKNVAIILLETGEVSKLGRSAISPIAVAFSVSLCLTVCAMQSFAQVVPWRKFKKNLKKIKFIDFDIGH